MGTLINPVFRTESGLSRLTIRPGRRREGPYQLDLYFQMLDCWPDYTQRLSENLRRVSVQQARRLVARNRLRTHLPEKWPGPHAQPLGSVEMRWLVKNNRRLEAHRGEWLLIQGEELIAHSVNFADIRAAIAVRNIRSPFVYYVPTAEEALFMSI